MTLRLNVTLSGKRHDLEVMASLHDTVGDLLFTAFGKVDPRWALELDGEPVDGGLLLSNVRPGSMLGVEPLPRGDASHQVAEVHVVAGPDAGRSLALPPGSHTLGEQDDRLVLDAGVPIARLDVGGGGSVRIWDAMSASPTAPHRVRKGEPVMIGRFGLRISPLRNGKPGRGPLSRPPRPSSPAPPQTTPLPGSPPPASPRPRIGWAALLAPVAMGGVMAAFLNPLMAVFALVGPLMLLAQWAEDRTGHRRRRSAEAAGFESDLHRLRVRLGSTAVAETDRIRALHPDPAEIVERATTGQPTVWERRRGDEDFLCLSVGLGPRRWTPPTEPAVVGSTAPEIAAVVEDCSHLPLVPIAIRLEPGSGAGIVGPDSSALRVGTGLVAQAVVLHGPADLAVTLIATPDRVERWEWLKWLPHRRGHTLLGQDIEPLPYPAVPKLPARGPVGLPDVKMPINLVLVDIAGPLPAEARRAITPRSALLFLTDECRHLPARCSTIVELSGVGGRCAKSGGPVGEVALAAGMSADVAEEAARALAGLSDPEVEDGTAGLPDLVRLLELIGIGEPTPEVISARWATAGSGPRLAATVGVSEDGPLVVDLVTDGPHGLVAGTTGSGKSELLRAIVMSLAAAVDPDHLVFVLVDYKGGSAFDACADLPHTVGLVTDLDERLAGRALICLEAELRHREERLRRVGAADLVTYRAAGHPEPLPSLLVVIDEFAALAAELPDFMKALLDIAQRGRSLGVHLLLATQRPAGVVSEGIKANTNIRIVLRVHDQADSADVLGSPDAAFLSRHTPGRAFLRLGPADRVAFQSALITASNATTEAGPRVRSFTFSEPPPEPSQTTQDGPTDLDRLATAIKVAATSYQPPRRPWPPPLPDYIDRHLLDPGCYALVDEPHRQRTVSVAHQITSSLLLYGTRGSGTTTALVSVALSLAANCHPDSLHIYVLDFDSQALGPLAVLPHIGAVIGASERERQTRLLRHLRAEVERRRGTAASGEPRPGEPGGGPSRIILLLDGFQGFSSAYDSPADLVWKETLTRLMADGPGFGVTVIATADRPGAIPASVAGLVTDRLVFRLADPYDYAAFGLRPPAGRVPPGRAIDAQTGCELQVASIDGPLKDEVAAVGEAAPPCMRPPAPIGVLPSRLGRRVDRPNEIRWQRMAGAGRNRGRLLGGGEPRPGRWRACARRRPTEIG